MKTALSIGSNLGNRLDNLKQARDRICLLPGVKLLSQSPVYETDPVDVNAKHSNILFLNAVLLIDCEVGPEELLKQLKGIESALGREASDDINSPRPIDIDIVFMGDEMINTPALTIPHPRWNKRLFVVKPLADLLPDLGIPGNNEAISDILLSLPKSPKVLPLCEEW